MRTKSRHYSSSISKRKGIEGGAEGALSSLIAILLYVLIVRLTDGKVGELLGHHVTVVASASAAGIALGAARYYRNRIKHNRRDDSTG